MNKKTILFLFLFLFLFLIKTGNSKNNDGGSGSRGDDETMTLLGVEDAVASGLSTTTRTSGPVTVPPEVTLSPNVISTLSRFAFPFDIKNYFQVFSDKSLKFTDYILSVSIQDPVTTNFQQLLCSPLDYEATCLLDIGKTAYLDRNIIVTLNSTFATHTFPISMFNVDSITQVRDTIVANGNGFDKISLIFCYFVIQATSGQYSYNPTLISSTILSIPIIDAYKYEMNGTVSFKYSADIVYQETLAPFVPFISSVSPPLVKLDTIVTVTGVFFFQKTIGSLVFNGSYYSEQNMDLYSLDFSNESIMYINGTALSFYFQGDASFTFKRNQESLPFSDTRSNLVNLKIVQPKIIDISYDISQDLLNIRGNFLDPAVYEISLNGLIFNTDSILPDPSLSTKTNLYFKNPQLYYSSAYLVCLGTSSAGYSQFKSQLIPKLVILDRLVKRGDRTIYLSGSYLLPNDRVNNPIYSINISSSGSSSSNPIQCYNIKVLKYLSFKQLYNISCQVDNSLENANRIQFNMVDTSVPPITFSFSYQPPTITSVSSTIYKKPGVVTIKGSSFCSQPTITIGDDSCSQPILSVGNDYDSLTCNFQSNAGLSNSTLLVSIICDTIQNTSSQSFVYIRDDPCPSSSTGVCSGPTNGKCNEDQRQCECNTGYSGFSCSNKVDTQVKPPIPIINDTKTVIETGIETGVQFEIGIIQIREIQSFNNDKVVKYINLKNEKWNLITKSTDLNDIVIYTYGLIVNNNKTKINVQIMINSGNSTSYDFLGDTFTLLPNSVKYQVEIIEWDFGATLNSLQVLFESKITATNNNNNCDNDNQDQEISKNILMNGQSIRTIEMKSINGDILVGTFSNRLKIDERVVVSSIEILSQDSLLSSNISTTQNQSVIQAITINYFKTNAIIDPNFGVLLSNDQNTPSPNGCNENTNSSNKFASWKIAVIVVCSVVGISLIVVSTSIIYRKIRNKSLILEIRLKLSK
ncbi:EGF-like domain-containing protein [Dictyostelium discoideum AX4]|uniref:EGF-like domain-containing protein n=1 Tax=Dictyostelium discoideum TaxID=44689 RepID=Q55E84_DICDI|nr:EGF-like domain-containing protein [Dictyostelium discoideum AX4]EAL72027.1 EGF-like domain-containing protein [Dictyostelium discoideum AX4]|eukprot:XP_645897.1 EGF-like domain-containing protein [Dictyostelium discoideum AX4]